MTIDFSKMLNRDEETALHPRDIFLALEKKPEFTYPRDIQTEVMNDWFEVRDQPDSLIKLNVGSGKTLVGLLILKSSLNEKKGPALYLAPNKQLVSQVLDEARDLGIKATDNPLDSTYSAGESICIINIYKLFNGRSSFGVGHSQIDIGTIVVDDAHACLSTLKKQFCIRLEHNEKAYNEIFSALSDDLKGYNNALYLDIQARDPNAYMEVPFWSWATHQETVVKSLSRHQQDDSLRFSYPLLRDVIQHSRCVIGGQHLEIEPPFPVTDMITSFRRAERRIYLTATLFDDSEILTHFSAKSDSISRSITPSSSQLMGERMILMPQELDPDLSLDDIQNVLSKLAKTVNVVVIVPSALVANRWRRVADRVPQSDEVIPAIHALRRGHVGLTVFLNRYDGIDLPNDACRVLVIDGLPEVNSYADLVDSQILGDSSVNLRRQIERIEQGMGRGVRSSTDYCVVLLIGARLTGRIRSHKGYQMLTLATKKQVDLSREISEHIQPPVVESIESVIRQCLDRDPAWIQISKARLLNLHSSDELRLDLNKLALHRAFQYARLNQYDEAMSALDNAIDSTDDSQVKAWLLSRKASFQHQIDRQGAQETQLSACLNEPSAVKPLVGLPYEELSSGERGQSETLISNHQLRFIEPVDMLLYADGLCADLQFGSVDADKFECAIDDLAWFLGFQSQRPEKNWSEGPDNLWILPNGCFIVIECKNGVGGSTSIARRDLGQLGQSIAWFSKRYPSSTYIPLLIHPQRTFYPDASPIPDMCVMDKMKLESLRSNLKKLAKQLARPNVSANISEVSQRLKEFGFSADDFIESWCLPI